MPPLSVKRIHQNGGRTLQDRPRCQLTRSDAMNSLSPDIKPLVIDADELKSLDEFHQAAAIILERRGRVIIRPTGRCQDE